MKCYFIIRRNLRYEELGEFCGILQLNERLLLMRLDFVGLISSFQSSVGYKARGVSHLCGWIFLLKPFLKDWLMLLQYQKPHLCCVEN